MDHGFALTEKSVMCLETQFLDCDIYSTLSICPNSVWCGLILASFTTAVNDHLHVFDADGARLMKALRQPEMWPFSTATHKRRRRMLQKLRLIWNL